MNTPPVSPEAHQARLTRLMAFHAADPTNIGLMQSAAEAAYEAHNYTTCESLLTSHEALRPLPLALLHLRGLCAMAQRQFDLAAQIFETLLTTQTDATVLYNLAYTRAMQGRFDEAHVLADQIATADVPAVVCLKLRVLHHLGRLDDAIALGKHEADHPEVRGEVRGLLASLLLDAGDMDGCRHYAEAAIDTPEGRTVSGLLALDDMQEEVALEQFRHALALQPQSGRARLGEGLSLLTMGRFADAVQSLDQAANLLDVHAGTWVAAGWAHLMNGDMPQARERFQQAMAIDRGFAEGSGGLAVVCIHEGKQEEAEHLAEVAMRLDRNCLSAAYAKSLLLAQANEGEAARAMRDSALEQPIGSNDKTIAQALARRSLIRSTL